MIRSWYNTTTDCLLLIRKSGGNICRIACRGDLVLHWIGAQASLSLPPTGDTEPHMLGTEWEARHETTSRREKYRSGFVRTKVVRARTSRTNFEHAPERQQL